MMPQGLALQHKPSVRSEEVRISPGACTKAVGVLESVLETHMIPLMSISGQHSSQNQACQHLRSAPAFIHRLYLCC